MFALYEIFIIFFVDYKDFFTVIQSKIRFSLFSAEVLGLIIRQKIKTRFPTMNDGWNNFDVFMIVALSDEPLSSIIKMSLNQKKTTK